MCSQRLSKFNALSGINRRPIFTVAVCVVDLFLLAYILNPKIYPAILILIGLACLAYVIIKAKGIVLNFEMNHACLKAIEAISNGVIFTLVFTGIILFLKFKLASYFFLALGVFVLFAGFYALRPRNKSF